MNERDEALGRLTEELADALAAGEAIDAGAWAARFGVDLADVVDCRRALQALDIALGEEAPCGHPELKRPELPGYTIEAELGRGGMGVVYRAQQDKLGRPVAIKVLRPGDLVFGDALARFRLEAKSLARLRHRHIVSVHDVGETKDGLVWFAMDLIDGEPLAAEIARRGSLLPARAVRILRQVTSAIAHAHAQGVVHRDLKPHNVLIDRQGDAYVVDFGLARDAASVSVHTVDGQLLGTPQYMSPEQAKGDVAAIGEASDVWALGALLYECLTGRGPFAGLPLHETILAILEDEPRPLRAIDKRVPEPLAAVVGKALRKRPSDRYGSALAFGEELERFAQGEPVLAKPPSRAAALARRAWRQRRGVVTALFAAVTVIGWFLWFVLPGVRLEGVLAAATTACDDGFPGAAVAPLRARFAELALNHGDRERCFDALLRALIDRTGELLTAGSGAAAAAAAQEAHDLLDAMPLRSDTGSTQQRWYRFVAAALPLALKTPATPNGLPPELYEPFRSALRGNQAARRIAHQVAMGADGAWMDLEDASTVVEVVLAMHALAAKGLAEGALFELAVPKLLHHRLAVAGTMRLARRDVVVALANSLPAHATDVHYHRLVLGSLFRACGLPGSHWFEGGGRWESDAALLADARSWATILGAAAQAPPEQALTAIRERLVQDTLGDGARRAAASPDLLSAVAVWSGHSGGHADPASVRRAATEASREPVAEWLARAGGVAAGERTTAAELLEAAVASRSPVESWARTWLLRLRAGAAVDAPLCHAPAGDQLLAWRRGWRVALGVEDTRQYAVQIALLHFADGSATPDLLATAAATTGIGTPFRLTAATRAFAPMLHATKRGLFAQSPQPRDDLVQEGSLRAGEVVAQFRGVVLEDAHGPFLGLDLHDGAYDSVVNQLPRRTLSGSASGPRPRLRPGHAASGQRKYVMWERDARHSDFVLLVRLARPGDLAMPDLAEWRASYVRHLGDWSDPGTDDVAPDLVTASLWHLPEASAALRAAVARNGNQCSWPLPIEGIEVANAPWRYRQTGDGAALVRLLTGEAPPALQERAAEALTQVPSLLTPGPAATLLRAHTAGRVELSAALLATARKVAAQPTFPLAPVLGLLVILVTLAGFAVSARVRRWRGPAAVVGLLGCCLLLFTDLRVAGVGVVPANVALAGMLIGLWLAPVRRGGRWRLAVAATAAVLALSVAWDSRMSTISLRGYEPEGWLVVLAFLTVLQLLTGDTTLRVTAPRPATA